MARVILDTDILSEVLKRKDPRVLARAEAYLDEHQSLTITAISVNAGRNRARSTPQVA